MPESHYDTIPKQAPRPWRTEVTDWSRAIVDRDGLTLVYSSEDGYEDFVRCVDADLRLMALAPDMLAMLKRLEWSADDGHQSLCPCCYSPPECGHSAHCSLAALIREAEGA